LRHERLEEMTTTRASETAGAVSIRAAQAEDVARITALIEEAHLPPLFIDTFLAGFVLAERAGEMLGCGGLERYADAGVIRSVVVEPRAQGLGIGRQLSERLIAAASETGARELYLFTQDASDFWAHLGFADVRLDEWSAAPRACWQYQFISLNPEALPEIRTMRMYLRA